MADQDRQEGDGPELTAAEAALRVLSPAEQAVADRRRASDPAFDDAVAGWEDRFAPLAETVPSVAPPAELYSAIERRLFPVLAPATGRPGLWQSLAFWRTLSFGSLAAAAASIALVVAAPAPSQGPLVAALGPADAMTVMIRFDPEAGVLTAIPAVAGGAEERVPELWVIPEGGAPVSLGVLAAGDTSGHFVPEALRPHLHRGATLAVTMEQSGGSPSGAPTGPPVAAGLLTNL